MTRKMAGVVFVLLFTLLGALSFVEAQYQPTWESLDSRPLPSWYVDYCAYDSHFENIRKKPLKV